MSYLQRVLTNFSPMLTERSVPSGLRQSLFLKNSPQLWETWRRFPPVASGLPDTASFCFNSCFVVSIFTSTCFKSVYFSQLKEEWMRANGRKIKQLNPSSSVCPLLSKGQIFWSTETVRQFIRSDFISCQWRFIWYKNGKLYSFITQLE